MSTFDRRDPSAAPETETGHARRSTPDRKYRCEACGAFFNLPDMTVHHQQTRHQFSLRGQLIDLGSDVFAAEFGMPSR